MLMKKLILLATLLPLNAMAHPGHVELSMSTAVSFIIISTACAYALHRVISFAKENFKR
jgi:predicted RND superfamily exporter protein